MNKKFTNQDSQYNQYYSNAQNEKNKVPHLKGLAGMDAVALLEIMGFKVKLKGNGVGKVKSQSIASGTPIVRNSVIELAVI